MPCPKAIEGSAGGRIKVILGKIGDEYLFICNEDIGEEEWQSRGWTYGKEGPPEKLINQIKNCYKKDRRIVQVCFGQEGEWFVEGEKNDGSGSHAWWGGTYASLDIQELHGKGEEIKVSFGDNERSVIIKGKHAYRASNTVESSLIDRLDLLQKENEKVNFIVLISGGGYFISDTLGYDWSDLDGALLEELESGGNDPILDVSVASDGSWIVIRPNRYSCSQNVDDDLCDELTAFYSRFTEAQQQRATEIREYKQRTPENIQQELEENHVSDQNETNDEKSYENEIYMKEEIHRAEEIERKRVISEKNIQVGDIVTVIGFSNKLGDAAVKGIKTSGYVQIQSTEIALSTLVTIKDPRRITLYDRANKDSEDLHLIFSPDDNFEALAFGQYLNSKNGKIKSVTQRDEHMNYAQLPIARRIDGVLNFDEYICTEKINIYKLYDLLDDLDQDSTDRDKCLKKISKSNMDKDVKKSHLKKLNRCKDLEQYCVAFSDFLSKIPIDDDGYVEYAVHYEHKDPSGRGRVFAKGKYVKSKGNEKYGRTTTLQGMFNDLRPYLVGDIAYDIDCVNSEFRILCSLAAQLDTRDLIPTVFDYRFKREKWLDFIASRHDVSQSEAKKLPIIILCGGTYTTWLRAIEKEHFQIQDEVDLKKLQSFVFRLQSEIAAFRDELLRHPRFKWTCIDTDYLTKQGKKGGALYGALMARIVQNCENEILGIIHRFLQHNHWNVLALIHDGVIVEKGQKAVMDLDTMMKETISACLLRGWTVDIKEKPLHSLQNEDIATVVEAREIVKEFGF